MLAADTDTFETHVKLVDTKNILDFADLKEMTETNSTPDIKRMTGQEFYLSMGSPKNVVAPMVDASELAWRMLGRKYGADLCFTPMFHAGCFVRDPKYRSEALQTCSEDRPLIVQFCANDPEIFVQAIRLTLEQLPDCDAIDLNLGCPQIIAKRGHFGSFLQDEWELLTKMISSATASTTKPITAKCRVFQNLEKTVEYARMLERAGAKMLTVHGRTREQKGPLTGLASWEHIKHVKEAVEVPVVANGNIQSLRDVEECIRTTGVDGVMSAEGHLTNPAIFAGTNPPVWEMALEYLDLVSLYPCPISFARGHLFKMLHHTLQIRSNFDLREVIAKTHSLEDFRNAVLQVRERYFKYHEGEAEWEPPEEIEIFNLKLPPWLCQPYVRPPPDVYLEKMRKIKEEEQKTRELKAVTEGGTSEQVKREMESESGVQQLSKKKQKRLERQERNPRKQGVGLEGRGRENCKLCEGPNCNNPCALKCEHMLCRKCCKDKAWVEELDCLGHRVFVKTSREKARLKEASSKENITEEVNIIKDQVNPTMTQSSLATGEVIESVKITSNIMEDSSVIL